MTNEVMVRTAEDLGESREMRYGDIFILTPRRTERRHAIGAYLAEALGRDLGSERF